MTDMFRKYELIIHLSSDFFRKHEIIGFFLKKPPWNIAVPEAECRWIAPRLLHPQQLLVLGALEDFWERDKHFQ
jgi:hypothetical protein